MKWDGPNKRFASNGQSPRVGKDFSCSCNPRSVMDFAAREIIATLLVDNGSLQPAAVRSLREIAAAVSARVGRVVEPVSLLHSSAIPAEALGGTGAEILEPCLRRHYAEGRRLFRIVPLFFGPSRALTEYIPERMEHLTRERTELRVTIAEPVVDTVASDRRLACAMAERVRETIATCGLTRPDVVLVDHGSPVPAVTHVRDHVARQLTGELGDSVRSVTAASMERRPGAEFDFNEPLLERAILAPHFRDGGGVVVAPMFFSPGRHAGPGGDIERICRASETTVAGLRVYIAPVIGAHPALIEILVERCVDKGG